MNIKEYISSGVLELYVLDLLTEDERKEVENHIVDYPEINKEIESLENALLVYSIVNSRKPPTKIKHEILNEINNL